MGMLDDIFARIGQGALAEGAPVLLPRYLENEGLPPPPGAAAPDFAFGSPARLPPAPHGPRPKISFPPPQIFGEAIPAQGFGDEAPLAPAAAPPPVAPPAAAGAPAAPSWLGMLNAPMDYPRPPAAPASRSDVAPAPVASAPPAPSPASVPETSLMGRFGDFLSKANDWRENNRLTLMALGAGMAGAQSLGQGLNRGMTMALPAMQQDIAQQRLNATIPVLRDRLMKSGLSADDATKTAMAAVGNPAIMQQIIPGVFGAKQRKFTQIGEDAFGGKEYGFVDEVSGKVYRLDGAEVTPGSGGGAGSEFLAKGVNQVDQNLMGEDYLKQFSPEVQAAVHNYVAGESMPTGNPRKGFTQTMKMVAQKFGRDMGIQVDDNTYAARHKAVTGLASTTPGSLGGQMTYARTSLNHLGDVGESAVDLDNSNGFGIAPLATLINSARGLSTDQAAKVAALADKTGHYGQEITKYYAGSPGGEAERLAFLEKLKGSKSSQELAAVLEAELQLARGKISKTQATIDESLGPGSKYQVLRPDEQRDIERVEAAIARLRGLPAPGRAAPTTPAAPAQAGVPAPGHYQWTPDRGLILVQ